MSPRQREILRQANERYGEGVYFVYLSPSNKQLVSITLEQAMAICGRYIAGENNSVLWATLDKWRDGAVRLESGYPDRFETSRAFGQQALVARGIEVK